MKVFEKNILGPTFVTFMTKKVGVNHRSVRIKRNNLFSLFESLPILIACVVKGDIPLNKSVGADNYPPIACQRASLILSALAQPDRYKREIQVCLKYFGL
jgi:hypothetical protein